VTWRAISARHYGVGDSDAAAGDLAIPGGQQSYHRGVGKRQVKPNQRLVVQVPRARGGGGVGGVHAGRSHHKTGGGGLKGGHGHHKRSRDHGHDSHSAEGGAVGPGIYCSPHHRWHVNSRNDC
jgi:hypothetical protein